MRNITVTLDDETARWARLEAARREVSVSRLIRDVLGQHIRSERSYATAMNRFMRRKPKRLKRRGSYPARADLHDRAGLRR